MSIIRSIIRGAMAVMMTVMALDAYAQGLSNEVELIDQSGSDVILKAVIAAPKANKEAEDIAIRSAITTLLNNGVEGINNGNPMLTSPDNSYEGRLATSKRYLMMLSGKPVKKGEFKYNGMSKITYEIPLNIKALKNDLEKQELALHPAWADSKKEMPVVKSAIRPVIVVIPETNSAANSFEDMRDLLDENPAYKGGVNKLTKLFGDNGFTTRDFRTALENSKTDDLLREGAQTDARTMVVQNMPGDIVVKMDIDIKKRDNSNGANVAIRAVERQTEAVLASESFMSGFYHVSDPVVIVDKALDKVAPEFFTKLGEAFDRMAAEGRSMQLDFNLSESVSDWDFDLESPADGSDFKDELYEWLRDNSFKGICDMSLSTSKYIKGTLNIPLWDNEKNRSYRVENFTSALKRFLNKKLGGEYKVNVTALGQKLSIMIE